MKGLQGVIDGAKCPVCGKAIKCTEATKSRLEIQHNSVYPNCEEWNKSLMSAYYAIDGKALEAEFIAVLGKN